MTRRAAARKRFGFRPESESSLPTLTVQEAELSTKRRFGATERSMLVVQSNLPSTYGNLGQYEQALRMRREVYTRTLKIFGEGHTNTLLEANNYAVLLVSLKRYANARSHLRKTVPVARRVLGENNGITLSLREIYGRVLFEDPAATLDDLNEAVTMLEDTTRIARRVLGAAHPLAVGIGQTLRDSARAALRAHETP